MLIEQIVLAACPPQAGAPECPGDEDEDGRPGPQPPLSDEPPVPHRDELPGTPRPGASDCC
jgi:hypothetical protein